MVGVDLAEDGSLLLLEAERPRRVSQEVLDAPDLVLIRREDVLFEDAAQQADELLLVHDFAAAADLLDDGLHARPQRRDERLLLLSGLLALGRQRLLELPM